ncbi:hypothetical protein BC941DRAFT_517582 [Chlamydoabsidia padenii]|nr:hypothetical protein BC941DRAFT_517582 [Chlamydoabsidia padenii]
MAQYQKPLLHNSQDMMQELFEEINGYLGDQGKPTADIPSTSILSPFNVSTEGEEDDDSIENNQYTTTTNTIDSNNESIKSLSPLQAAMFVESDDDDSLSGGNRYPTHPTDHTEQAVCVCYKCKDDKDDNNNNNNAAAIESQPSSTFTSRLLRRPKSTSSFGVVNSAKLAHIAGLVKQTLSSTPRDIITSPSVPSSTHNNLLQPSFDNAEKHHTPSPKYGYEQHKDDPSPFSAHLHEDGIHSENSMSSHTAFEKNDPSTLYNDSGYGLLSSPTLMMGSFEGQDLQYQDVQGALMDSSYNNTSFDLDSFPGEKQVLVEPVSSTHLPFLTPSLRMGEPHVIALRTKMARDVGSHDDRINAYNNAYSHCIMAKTDMVPWIKKQYSKGPPELVTSYIPRPKRSSKALFGLFKRHSKVEDSTSLAVTDLSDLASTSISSGKSSSFMMESLHTPSPQPARSPSQQSQPQHFSSNVLLSPLNGEESCTPVNTMEPSRSLQPKLHGKQRRSPSPSSGHKKSNSFASMEEPPVSILKKSSSAANLVDEPVSILKQPSPVSGFMDEPCSGLKSSRSQPVIGSHEDRPTSILKSRSPSPSVSMESRHPTRHRSRSPIPAATSNTSSNHHHHHNNSNNKRTQLLCPPSGSMYTTGHLDPQRQRSRSVSPSPRSSSTHKNRSSSPMSRSSSPFAEQGHNYHHSNRQPPPRRSLSPSPSTRHYTSQDQYLSPRRHSNVGGHYRSSSNSSLRSSPSNDYDNRKIHRARSSEYLDMAPSRDYGGDSYLLLPLEQQAPRPRRLSNSSHQYHRRPHPASLASTGRRVTDPPPMANNQKVRAGRRKSMVMDDMNSDYFTGPSTPAPRRWSTNQQPPSSHYLSKRQTKVGLNNHALDDLCAFFQHMPRHVLANYLQEAHGDFYLAKDLCMEDIMDNGI